MSDPNSGFEDGMRNLLLLLGADPDNPPPPPVEIDIEEDQIPERIRGPHEACFGCMETRVSFRLKGVNYVSMLHLMELVRAGSVTTREQMLAAMADFQPS